MLRTQLLVVGQIALVVVAIAWFLTSGHSLLPTSLPTADDTAARLGLAVGSLVLPALTLLIGIGTVAARRFFSADAIDGTRTPLSRSLEINLRYNQNTVEQLLLAAIAWGGLALALPHENLWLIPALAALFVLGRALFWIGYLIAPWVRAIGFGFSMYPSACALAWLAVRAL